MKSRSGRCLLDGQGRHTIRLTGLTEPAKVVSFRIRETVEGGEGGSCVCYIARCGRKWGTLKEFYPLGRGLGFSLTRGDGNQLLPDAAGAQRFYDRCAELIRAYDRLDELKAAHRVLTNVLPSCELFWGMAEDGRRGSVYIWTADDKQGQSFDAYLRQIRGDPTAEPERKLYNVVAVLATVTDCVGVLHSAGMLHLDLKPANFLVAYDGRMGLNTQNISLFDINSLCSAEDPFCSRGTPGFRAPETARGMGENRSDLYSVGAMLYYGIVGTVYAEGQYDRLEEVVAGARLIRASRANAAPVIRYLLTGILKKCLHTEPNNRYADCESLLEDLRRLQAYMLPAVFGGRLGGGRSMEIRDRGGVGTGALQELLYRRPLYEAVPADAAELRVLVLGGDRYARKFVDLCLQAGQLTRHLLKLRVVTRDAALERAAYVHDRPELTRFVEVDGADCPDPYGVLEFVEGTVTARDRGGIRRILGEKWHYIFISTGDEGENRALAEAAKAAAGRIPVAYVTAAETAATERAVAVDVGRPVQRSAELQRMALNVHLCWKGQAAGLRQARKEFKKPYYFESSISNALAIGYKLYDLQIPAGDPEAAAEALEAADMQERVRALMALEHRRWVMEKVTNGWTLPRNGQGAPDVEGCAARRSLVDQRRKQHLCLLRSTAHMPLEKADFPWDGSEAVEEMLDPLDRMSVALHRQYRAMSRALRLDAQPLKGDLEALEALAERAGTEAARAYGRYGRCVQGILDGDVEDTLALGTHEEILAEKMGALGPEGSRRLGLLRQYLHPAIQANLRRDYKKNDEMLVRRIPFILTNRPGEGLITVFSGTETVTNVASVLVLQPDKLTYLLPMAEDADGAQWGRLLDAALSCLHLRDGAGQVYILAAGAGAARMEEHLQALRAAGCISGYGLLPCTWEQLPQKLAAALKKRKAGLLDVTNTAAWDEQTRACFVEQASRQMPVFRCGRDGFIDLGGCGRLRHIPREVFLRGEEALALMGAPQVQLRRPTDDGQDGVARLCRAVLATGRFADGGCFDRHGQEVCLFTAGLEAVTVCRHGDRWVAADLRSGRQIEMPEEEPSRMAQRLYQLIHEEDIL